MFTVKSYGHIARCRFVSVTTQGKRHVGHISGTENVARWRDIEAICVGSMCGGETSQDALGCRRSVRVTNLRAGLARYAPSPASLKDARQCALAIGRGSTLGEDTASTCASTCKEHVQSKNKKNEVEFFLQRYCEQLYRCIKKTNAEVTHMFFEDAGATCNRSIYAPKRHNGFRRLEPWVSSIVSI